MTRIPSHVRAVLFDRDGTLVHDVPYNGDPALVRPVNGAARAVAALHAAGIGVGVITNQSGIGRGLISREQVDAVNARTDALVGPFDVWEVCPHVTEDHCPCRKPAPGMVLDAAYSLGLDPQDVVVIGDIGADMEAATAAGAIGILVPTRQTLAAEVETADIVMPTLVDAVALVLHAVGPVTA